MKPAPFAYHHPDTLAEALTALAGEPHAKVLAGGQSLIPLLSMRLTTVPALVDINAIGELAQIRCDTGGVRFGATVRHTALLDDEDAWRCQPLIRKALRHVAHPTIRNRGTTLGSIVHADASAEMPAVLALLAGTVTATSASGTRDARTRDIAARDFFTGPMESALEPGEIATEAFLPALAPSSGVAFDEVARRNGDYALCGVAAIVDTDENGAIASARASYLSVCETPVVVDVTAALADRDPAAAAWQQAGQLALESLSPESDIHASAEYRAQLVRVLTTRVVKAAYDNSQQRRRAGVAV